MHKVKQGEHYVADKRIIFDNMSYVDIAILIPMLYAAYKGIKKGFIIEIATLIALIVGIYGALHFSFYTEGLLTDKTDLNAKYVPLTAMALTFIALVIGIHFLARFIEKLVKLVALGLVNRIFGMVFSLTKMGLIISFLLVFINSLDEKYNLIAAETKQNSMLYEPFSAFGPMILPMVTESSWYTDFNLDKQIDEVINSVDLD